MRGSAASRIADVRKRPRTRIGHARKPTRRPRAGRAAGAWRCGGIQPAVCVNVKVSAGSGGSAQYDLDTLADRRVGEHEVQRPFRVRARLGRRGAVCGGRGDGHAGWRDAEVVDGRRVVDDRSETLEARKVSTCDGAGVPVTVSRPGLAVRRARCADCGSSWYGRAGCGRAGGGARRRRGGSPPGVRDRGRDAREAGRDRHATFAVTGAVSKRVGHASSVRTAATAAVTATAAIVVPTKTRLRRCRSTFVEHGAEPREMRDGFDRGCV